MDYVAIAAGVLVLLTTLTAWVIDRKIRTREMAAQVAACALLIVAGIHGSPAFIALAAGVMVLTVVNISREVISRDGKMQ